MRNRWALTAGLVILAVVILAGTQWPGYPYFLDSYYHLSVIQGFRTAGGPTLHAFWESAPEGRPHLYPPLFHLIGLPAVLLGIPPLVLARIWSWAALPLLLIVAWVVLRRLFNDRTACLTVVVLATPFSFFLSSVNYLPATLVLTCSLGILLALSKARWLAGGLLLGLAFWLHAGFPWLLLLALALFGVIAPAYRWTVWKTMGLGILIAAPWTIHMAKHLSLFRVQPRGEEQFLETPILLLLLGVVGLKVCWNRGGIHRFFVALALGFLPMLVSYRFRFFAAQGLFPLLLLAGQALDRLAGKIRPAGLAGLGLTGLALVSPTLYHSPKDPGIHWAWADSTLPILAGRPQPVARGTANPLFHAKFMEPLALGVRAHTRPEDLIWCRFPYFGGMLSVLTERATTNGMLREFQERSREAQIRLARMIVWLKDPVAKVPREMEQTALQYHLQPLGETEIAYLYLNPHPTGKRKVTPAVLPWWVASGLMGLAVAAAVWDLKR